MTSRFRLRRCRWVDGEHYSYLEDLRSGTPHLYSLLYVTAQVRNAGLSLSAMESALKAINVLYLHFEESGIDVEERFKRADYLSPQECEQLRRGAQRHLGKTTEHSHNVVRLGRGKTRQPMTKGALNAVFREIRDADPQLSHLHPHILRHHFNEALSRIQHARQGERNFHEEGKIRNHLNGWSPDSKMGYEVYARRHIERKALAAGLELQAQLGKGSQASDEPEAAAGPPTE